MLVSCFKKETSDKQILYNYLCYTYDRIKAENKIEISDDKSSCALIQDCLLNMEQIFTHIL